MLSRSSTSGRCSRDIRSVPVSFPDHIQYQSHSQTVVFFFWDITEPIITDLTNVKPDVIILADIGKL